MAFFHICFIRGPSYGYRGKVVLAFEDNGAYKIGVRFDRSIPEGNDLGGLCEEDHGFFCAGNFYLTSQSPLINLLPLKYEFVVESYLSIIFCAFLICS